MKLCVNSCDDTDAIALERMMYTNFKTMNRFNFQGTSNKERCFWGGVSNFKAHISKFSAPTFVIRGQSVSVGPFESISVFHYQIQ